jgi:hypothetical protein
MLSHKVEKDYLPDYRFERSFTLSLVAIALLTLALPLLTPANQVAPGNASEPATSVKAIAK